MYTITLSGGGDTFIYLVTKEDFNWVVDGSNIPEGVINHFMNNLRKGPLTREEAIKKLTPSEQSSSKDNDRALLLMKVYSGKSFNSVKSITSYVKKNKIKVIDSFEGFVY